MAEPADTAERQLSSDASAPVDDDPVTDEAHADEAAADSAEAKRRWRQGVSTTGAAIAAGLVGATVLGALAGWLGYQAHETDQTQAQRAMFVQAARQAALNLTTINYTEAQADIQRILDSAIGTFHDDFQTRSKPFIDVVIKAQSRSEGTVTEAALESQTGDQAQVLVAVSVKTTTGAAAQQQPEPHAWRMRIGLHKLGDNAKVSDVQFVP